MLIRDIADGMLCRELEISPALRDELEPLLRRDPRKARELEAIVRRTGTLYPRDVWAPDGLLIGTWTGGSVGPYLRQLPQFYGDAIIRDLGLVASEGRFTIPVRDETSSGVLDITQVELKQVGAESLQRVHDIAGLLSRDRRPRRRRGGSCR